MKCDLHDQEQDKIYNLDLSTEIILLNIKNSTLFTINYYI